ncbi:MULTISPECIES: flavin monoamine oxidase family protein [Cryobacterium]|nr:MULTISPECIES: NAD(P)/FAD-dependent oxidoreductase [Cryobacterium]
MAIIFPDGQPRQQTHAAIPTPKSAVRAPFDSILGKVRNTSGPSAEKISSALGTVAVIGDLIMKVIIIGAGLAGLTAAWELHKLGHETTILEARNRVGGRTWSQKLSNGQLTERGGEYVFPTEFEIRRLSAEVGVPVLTHNVRYGRRTVGTSHVSFAELNETSARLSSTLTTMLGDGLDRVSVDDVYSATLGGNFRANPLYCRIRTSLAADPARISAEAAILHESSSANGYVEDGGRFLNGNQSLALELARRLAPAVRLESPVIGVDQSRTGVQVTLADGGSIDADAAVITVPFPLLRSLALGFDLNPAQRIALDHRFMGTAAKLGVPLTRVDGDSALQHGDQAWWSWRSMSADGENRVPALSCFAGGEATLQALETVAGPRTWLAALQEMRPELVLDGDPLLTDWTSDEWAQGSYSAASLDWTADDIGAFKLPSGRVAIAGEHTGIAQSLNGAVESGVRAAAALRLLS